MNFVVPQQPVDSGRTRRVVLTPICVQKDRPYHVGTMSTTSRTKLTHGRFHDRQRITATTPADVQMHNPVRFLGKESEERRIPHLAFAFAAHEDAPALRAVSRPPRH